MSFILIGSLLIILFNGGETIRCPNSTGYNSIVNMGCYKVVIGSNKTWSEAHQDCENDINATLDNQSLNGIAHLLTLEQVMEKTAISNWLDAFNLQGPFWTDGIVSSSTWNWSNQSITWFFSADERAIIGNGTHYKLIYNQTNPTSKYEISDDIETAKLNYICEYQVPCNGSGSCQNGGACYSNMGQDLCLCEPGYTGQYCENEIDQCLSSPCLHGGICINRIDNYTCNCSNIFYEGQNCEIPTTDPTQHERFAAFWSVVGVVTGLIVLLTLSDLPWDDILSAIGCSCNCLSCCSKQDDIQISDENDLRLSDSPTNDQNYRIHKSSMSDGSSPPPKGTNYHIMNTAWEPGYRNNQTPPNIQYNGYRSPDSNKTQAVTGVVKTKQKQNQIENKPIYTVRVNEPKSKNSVDAMVNWTQQLQEQLKNKKPRQTSASSTEQLIHKTYSNDS